MGGNRAYLVVGVAENVAFSGSLAFASKRRISRHTRGFAVERAPPMQLAGVTPDPEGIARSIGTPRGAHAGNHVAANGNAGGGPGPLVCHGYDFGTTASK